MKLGDLFRQWVLKFKVWWNANVLIKKEAARVTSRDTPPPVWSSSTTGQKLVVEDGLYPQEYMRVTAPMLCPTCGVQWTECVWTRSGRFAVLSPCGHRMYLKDKTS